MERVFIGIGSNLFNPQDQVNSALRLLSDHRPIKLKAYSSYYESRPLGGMCQPNFLNVVAIIDTTLSPIELLDYIQWIEIRQGRVRGEFCYRWDARPIDIDILLFGDKRISTDELIIPHYDMFNREFVLYPLYELIPNFRFSNGKMLFEYLKKVPKNGLKLWKTL